MRNIFGGAVLVLLAAMSSLTPATAGIEQGGELLKLSQDVRKSVADYETKARSTEGKIGGLQEEYSKFIGEYKTAPTAEKRSLFAAKALERHQAIISSQTAAVEGLMTLLGEVTPKVTRMAQLAKAGEGQPAGTSFETLRSTVLLPVFKNSATLVGRFNIDPATAAKVNGQLRLLEAQYQQRGGSAGRNQLGLDNTARNLAELSTNLAVVHRQLVAERYALQGVALTRYMAGVLKNLQGVPDAFGTGGSIWTAFERVSNGIADRTENLATLADGSDGDPAEAVAGNDAGSTADLDRYRDGDIRF